MTNNGRWLLLILGLFTLLQATGASAQVPDRAKSRKWVTLGAGGGQSLSSPSTPYAGITLSYNFGRRLLHQVRFIYVASQDREPGRMYIDIGVGWKTGHSSFNPAPKALDKSEFASENLESVGYRNLGSLSYAVGRGSMGKHHLTALFAGLGRVTSPGGFRPTVGLVLNAQAFFYPFRGFGLGIDFYTNLNLRTNFGVLYWVLVFGGNRRLAR